MTLRVASAAINVLRSNHYVLNSVTGLYQRTTLLERTKTNEISRSAEFETGSWTASASSVSANATLAPDGLTITADKLIEDATNAEHRTGRSVGAIGNGVEFTLSCFFKAAERSNAGLSFVCSDGVTERTGRFVLLGDGQVASGTATRKHIERLSNGWYRCQVSGTNTAGGSALQIRIWIEDVVAYQGNGSSGVYAWGAQAEIGTVATSYIPTTSAAVARSDDALSFPFSTTLQDLTVYAEVLQLAPASTNSILIIGSTSNGLEIYNTSTDFRAEIRGTPNVTATGGVPLWGTRFQLCAQFRDFAVGPTCRLDVGAGFGSWSSASDARSALGAATFKLGDGSNGKAHLVAVTSAKVGLGLRTMAEMQALADMETAVLVLNAGDADAITVVCTQANAAESEDIGGRTRAFAGNLRVSTRDQKRSFQVITSLLTATEAQAIEALIADNVILPCSGILFGNETASCSVKCTGSAMHAGTSLFTLSLTVTEV